MSQDWQYCKKDLVPSREIFVDKLYNAGVHLNLDGEIFASRTLVLIFVRLDKADLKQSGTFGKEGETGGNALCTTITTNASITISVTISLKVRPFGDTFCDNLQSANDHTPVLF